MTSSNTKYTHFVVQKHTKTLVRSLNCSPFLRNPCIQTGYAVIVSENWLCISNKEE